MPHFQHGHLLLTLAQLLTPLPPTSERPQYSVAYRAHIYMLNCDALLNIFHYYRLEDIDSWNLQLAWCKLAHVCQRWRNLIYDSSSLLDMYLLLKNGSPTLGSLAHLPPLPLVIDYCNTTTTRARQDELSMLTGLQERGRVRRIFLQVPSPNLGICLATMSDPYPILEDLTLSSTTEEHTSLVLPSTFSARNLRYLALQGVGFPTELPFFTYFTTLVTLTLTGIPARYYFHPGHLVTQLQGLHHLEELSIGFDVPIPLPSTEGNLLPAPMPRVTLPTLKRLTFRGVAVYLENLVAQINSPLLERLIVVLFFEIDFTLVSLTQFVHATAGLRCLSAKVLFKKEVVSIVTNNGESLGGCLTINVNCELLDWQIDAATQCCRALEQVLAAVEELTLDLDEDHGTPPDWDDSVDNMLWHGLLLPFSSVKRLQIGPSLSFGLSHALEPDVAELDLNLLPELEKLEVQPEVAFSMFIVTRELEGRPLESLVPRLSRENIQTWLSPPDSYKHDAIVKKFQHSGTGRWWIDGEAFLKWKNSGPSSLLWIRGKRQCFGRSVLFRGTHNLHVCSRSREDRPLVCLPFYNLSPGRIIRHHPVPRSPMISAACALWDWPRLHTFIATSEMSENRNAVGYSHPYWPSFAIKSTRTGPFFLLCIRQKVTARKMRATVNSRNVFCECSSSENKSQPISSSMHWTNVQRRAAHLVRSHPVEAFWIL